MGETGDNSKTLRELFSPITTNPPSYIVLLATTATHFELKPQIIHLFLFFMDWIEKTLTCKYGKQVDNQVKMPEVEDNENTVLEEKGVHSSQDDHKEKKGNSTSIPIQDLSSPLDRSSIPFLDAVQQVPAYAKFLKDLVTIKRKKNVLKNAFLIEQVSSIIQNKYPVKCKDLGSPTISCKIEDRLIERVLLDLGASVNLMPYLVYLQLHLGELKPKTMTLQLADRSVKIPKGIVEDVLIKVDAFYFLVDFVVLDTEPALNASTQIHVVLGYPFLATSNALINCWSGVMKISFGI
ncbi:uncharacterized protein LOC111992076 [Quercus suber]|uniref:uncharacterized protein LOC111992076 n=1 Tax=Quercus suber TaxID=58331 RepID=UPI0032DEE3D6